MKRTLLILVPMALLVIFGSFDWNSNPKLPGHSTHQITQDTAFDQAAALAALKEKIKGKEDKPAEEVFENIQTLKGFPAGRLLAIMQFGFSNSLGVSCDHCHNTDNWASEENTNKQVARDMWALVGKINGELLAKIENLNSEQVFINCTTCHRGEVKPATN